MASRAEAGQSFAAARGVAGCESSDIVKLLTDACARSPLKPALIFDDGVTVSRQDLLAAVAALAGELAELTRPGERIAVILDNRTELFVAWFAAASVGAVLVALNPASPPAELERLVHDAGVSLIVTTPDRRRDVQALAERSPAVRRILWVDGAEPFGLAAPTAASPSTLARPDATALTNIYFTSGSTGLPKGCMVGHDYWLRLVDLYLRLYGLGPDDRLLSCLKFFYNDPSWQLLASLHADTTLVAMRRFSVTRYWDVVGPNGVTQLFAIGSIPSMLLSAPPHAAERDHAVRFALQVAIPARQHEELRDRFGMPWLEAYGLTESGLVVAMPLEAAERMTGSGSLGVPCPEVEVRVVSDDGSEVRRDTVGELHVRAPGFMRGYWNAPAATAEVLDAGWLQTGDLVRRDGDGWLYFVGRKKDVIRRNGENVGAREVEDALRAMVGVLEAAVVAVDEPIRGEEVLAFVALDPTVAVVERAVVEHCATLLPRYKVPRFLIRWDEFERTPSMRVRKASLPRSWQIVRELTWDRERELGW